MTQKILVLVAHPDDEILICGGSLARHIKEGGEVTVCIVTKAYTPEWSDDFIKNRSDEIIKAHEILGVKTILLDFPTVKLDQLPQKQLNEAIFNVVSDIDPDIVYSHWKGDLNKDHRLIFYSILVATRPANRRIKRVLAGETLSVSEWGYSIEPFVPNYYVRFGQEELDKKLEAMQAYKSELKVVPHPRSLEIIEALAKKRGSEVYAKYAEAFYMIREIY